MSMYSSVYSPVSFPYPPTAASPLSHNSYSFLPIVSPVNSELISFSKPDTRNVITPNIEQVIELTEEDIAAADVVFNWPRERENKRIRQDK